MFKSIKKSLMYLIVIFIGLPFMVNAQGLISHNFDDGDMGPFVDCTTKSPNYAKVVNKRLETYWIESSYNGTRMTKGAEACGNPDAEGARGIGYLTYKYCWLGFTINIDEGYMADNPNTEAGLMQIFGFYIPGGEVKYSSWTAMLDFKKGDITWVDRRNLSTKTYALVYEDFPKGQDVNVIVHAVLSGDKKGMVEIWMDGVMRYSRYNINIGMGLFDDNDTQISPDSYTEFKIGQYDYKNDGGESDGWNGVEWFDGYLEDEVRIVRYDNISWYDGEDGYDIVNPGDEDPIIVPDCGDPQDYETVNTFDSQNEKFEYTFDVATTGTVNNGVVGLSGDASADAFSDLATIVQFADDGNIKARNAAVYEAENVLAWESEKSYSILMTVDFANKTYDVSVTSENGSAVTIATDYSFRSDWVVTTGLDRAIVKTTNCPLTVSNFSLTPIDDVTNLWADKDLSMTENVTVEYFTLTGDRATRTTKGVLVVRSHIQGLSKVKSYLIVNQ